jgi:hypothetical protein
MQQLKLNLQTLPKLFRQLLLNMSNRISAKEFARTGFWAGRTKDTVHVLDNYDSPKKNGLVERAQRLLGVRRPGRAGK